MSRIVVALGGNALGESPEEQMHLVQETAKPIVDLIDQGHELIVTHGNGPQVGMINLALEVASNLNEKIPSVPFPECGAMSQGYIGFHLQNAIGRELKKRNLPKKVASLITQVVVDKDDQAFTNPTKPVGSFYSEAEAHELIEKRGYQMVEDSGRGYRRVVPSPMPVDVVEKDIISSLIENGYIIICAGGGGIPVIKDELFYKGVSAVIDKDFASGKLAEMVDADYLFILTAVERVAINFGLPNQKDLDTISVEEINQYINEEHFAEGSMLPKVLAAVQFASSKTGRKTVIGSLDKAVDALKGRSGTVIYS